LEGFEAFVTIVSAVFGVKENDPRVHRLLQSSARLNASFKDWRYKAGSLKLLPSGYRLIPAPPIQPCENRVRPLRLLIVFLALLPSTNALAWGDLGHRTIALIAERYLDARAKARIDALLASDPDPLTAPDFASRATWADKYRDAGKRTYAPTGTEKWHFTNIELDRPDADAACFGRRPLTPGTAASAGPADSCSIDKVEQFAAELGDPATSPEERLLALKFLLHLVGDLHQPLHSADNHDAGGNGISVVAGFAPVKLHAYWDTEIVKAMGRDPRTIADSIAAEYGGHWREWSSGTPREWALDAYGKARTAAYALSQQAGTDTAGKPVYRIDADYERAARAVAREQMAKAGIRLAGLLNGALRDR
jgi:hypothetical protein